MGLEFLRPLQAVESIPLTIHMKDIALPIDRRPLISDRITVAQKLRCPPKSWPHVLPFLFCCTKNIIWMGMGPKFYYYYMSPIHMWAPSASYLSIWIILAGAI